MLRNVDDEPLRVYIVWLPMLRTDSEVESVEASLEFSDERLQYYWDEDKLSGNSWKDVLDMGATAWDVYLVYDAEAAWGDTAPQPDFWMHQLGGVKTAPRLNSEELERNVREMLEKGR